MGQLIEAKNPRKALIDWQGEWAAGSSGSQGSFSQNGATAENSVITMADPWGKDTKVWMATPDAVSGADGGWNKDFACDETKRYRLSVWILRTGDANGATYLGCNGSATDVLGGSANTNPYFMAGDYTYNQWVLWVGLIHPWTYPDGGASWGVSGIYDLSGNRLHAGTEFKMRDASSTTQTHRSYLYYCTNTANRQYWCYPRVDVVDGSEPSIMDLCQGLDSRYQEYHAEAADSQSMSVRISTYVQSVSEVGPNSGLWAWLPFNGDRSDLLGNYDGSGSDGTFVAGVDKQAIEFNAGAIDLALPTTIIPTTTQELTISFWANIHTNQASQLLYGLDASGYRVTMIHLLYNNGNTYWDCGNSGTSSYDRLSKANPSILNEWHFWTFTKNAGTGFMGIYLDGELWHSAGIYYRTIVPIDHWGNEIYNQDGAIDDLRVYERELSAQEVWGLYVSYGQGDQKVSIASNGVVYLSGQVIEN